MTDCLTWESLSIQSTKPKLFQKAIKEWFPNDFSPPLLYTVLRTSLSALQLLSDLLCQMLVKWYSEWHNVMSTCINFSQRDVFSIQPVFVLAQSIYVSASSQKVYKFCFLWKTLIFFAISLLKQPLKGQLWRLIKVLSGKSLRK